MTRTNYAPSCTCARTGWDSCPACGPEAGNFDVDCAECGKLIEEGDEKFEDSQGRPYCGPCSETTL